MNPITLIICIPIITTVVYAVTAVYVEWTSPGGRQGRSPVQTLRQFFGLYRH